MMQVCAFVGLCDGTSAQQAGQRTMDTSRRLLASQAAGQSVQGTQSVGDDPLCPFCTTAVTYIKVHSLAS